MTTRAPETLGLIAGNGSLPLVVAQAARRSGLRVVAFALQEETDPSLADMVDRIHWISVGQFKELLTLLRQEQISRAVMIGQIRHNLLFSDIAQDEALQGLLAQVKDKRTDSILSAVANHLHQIGIELIDSRSLITQYLPAAGVLTQTQPTPAHWEDITFGIAMAKAIAGLDIGQTVVVKNKVVVSVEAIEGTDEAIRRAHHYCQEGAVVVKVSKPAQDMRFDIPVIGRRTIDTLAANRIAALAIEAHKTFLLDREYVIQQADAYGIAVVAV